MRRRVIWLTTVLWIGFAGFVPSHAQEVENLLDNGGFEDGVVAPWSVWGGGATGEAVQQLVGAAIAEDPIEGKYCLHVVVPEAGENSWSSGLEQRGHDFEAGKHYTLSAFCKCNAGTLQIAFKPEHGADPWEGYGYQIFTMTEEWTEFSVTTPVFASDVSPGVMQFHIAFAAGDFWVDGVRWYEGDYVPPVLGPRPKARGPDPPDGATDVISPLLLQWTAGDTAAFHDVYFGTNPTPGPDEYKGRQDRTLFWAGALTPGTTYYWRIDEVEADETTIHTGHVWSFFAPPATAWGFSPADGAEDVFTEVTLSWNPGQGSVMYHLYFADDFDAVNDGTTEADKSIMTETSYQPGILYPETVHYWRVDAFDGTTSTWHTGDTLSFTTISGGTGKIIREWWYDIGAGNAVSDLTSNPNYPQNPTGWEFVDIFEGPVDVADNYGSRLRGWLFAPLTGDYIFWISSDNGSQLWLSTDEDPANKVMIAEVPGTNWTNSREWEKYPEQKSAAITLQEGKVYYIEALMKEGGGGDNIAVAWEGPIGARQVITGDYVGATPFLPVKAYSPSPGNGATDVTDTPTLTWLAGANAAQHDVFLGTDRAAVASADTTATGIYRGRQALAATSYVPTELPLAWDTTYYWRVDEVNAVHADSPWKGTVWSFTTANFIIVEDFEEYDDFCNRIFYKWKDGWGHSADPDCGVTASTGNGTGSTVGNLSAPYAEQTIVHGGNQSMPYEYNNTGAGGKARYSEASLEFATPQNWARNEVKALTLWFHGEAGNAPETLYVALEDSLGQVRVATHPDPDALQAAAWQQWNIALTQFSGVNLASVKKLYIGVGNRNNPQAGGSGKLYIDDIRLYRRRCVPSLAKPAADLSDNCIVDYADVQIVSGQWLNSGFMITPTDPGNSGLIAHYPLNGNANDVVGGHNGTTTGFVSYGAGKIGQAIILDGVDDLVTVGPVGISGAAARTISGWVKANATIDDLPNWINIFGFVGPQADPRDNMSFDMEIGEAQGRRGYVIHVYGWERVILDVDFEWHHLAASFDGTTIAWYGDGLLGGTDDSRPLDTRDQVHMGKRDDNANYFPGRVDEVRIFNRVLSEAQIAWLAGHTSPLSIPADLYQDDVIDFKDFAVLADAWLEEILWPSP